MRIHRAVARVLPGGNRQAPLAGITTMTKEQRQNWLMTEVSLSAYYGIYGQQYKKSADQRGEPLRSLHL